MSATDIRHYYDQYHAALKGLDEMEDDHNNGWHEGITQQRYDELMAEAIEYCRLLEEAWLWLEKNAPAVAKSLLTNL